jgi:hypothetical protein
MSDWTGDSIDVAWISLREPIRAKMQAGEIRHVEGQPLPPAPPRLPAPAPARASFQSAGPILPPPPPELEARRGPSASSALMILALGGLAAAGWYYRDDLRAEAARWQASLEPQSEIAQIPAPPPVTAPIIDASAPAAAAPADATPPAEAPPVADEVAPPPEASKVAVAMAETEKTPTLDDWVPPPVIRQIPRAPAPADPPFIDAPTVRPAVAVAAPAPPPAPTPSITRVGLRQGRFIDIDYGADPRRQTDIWFAPDKSGDGLYLGVTNGARMRVLPRGSAAAADCARSGIILRRTPIPARELARGMSVCVRTSADQLRVVHVEGIDGTGREKVLRLRLDPR